MGMFLAQVLRLGLLEAGVSYHSVNAFFKHGLGKRANTLRGPEGQGTKALRFLPLSR